MSIDIDTAVSERIVTARRLMNQAREGEFIYLATVSGMDLCALGGPRHPLFSTNVAQAWLSLGNLQRKNLMAQVTIRLVERGLLIPDERASEASYSVSSEFGLALAARCRPAFIIVAQAAGSERGLNLFALSDETDPIRGIVAEIPHTWTGRQDIERPLPQFEPLGWIYNYSLLSPRTAAQLIAGWMINTPPTQPEGNEPVPYVLSRYSHHDGSGTAGIRLTVWSEGGRARVAGPRPGDFDLDQLRGFVLDLITAESR